MKIGIAEVFAVALALLLASLSAQIQASEARSTSPNTRLEQI
jgi:hypothetical protein